MLPALIPELTVSNIAISRDFYCGILGWAVIYERPEERFVMLGMGAARLMLDALAVGRNFDATLTPKDRPFGRGMNLEIEVDAVQPMLDALAKAKYSLHLPPEDAWYRTGDHMSGQRQFIVADPDGYLLRFVQSLGTRPHAL